MHHPQEGAAREHHSSPLRGLYSARHVQQRCPGRRVRQRDGEEAIRGGHHEGIYFLKQGEGEDVKWNINKSKKNFVYL